MNYETYYKVINSAGVIILNYFIEPNICFNDYNFSSIFNGSNTIEILIKKKYDGDTQSVMVFSPEQIAYHTKFLNSIFPNSLKEYPDHYIITLFEKNYINHTHVRIALDFFRLLWEKDINLTLVYYFNLSKSDRKKINYFVALQAIFIYLKILSLIIRGHDLPCTSYITKIKSILTEEKVLDGLKNLTIKGESSMNFWSRISNSGQDLPLLREQILKIKTKNCLKIEDLLEIVKIINEE